jgi:hypothetical protein
LLLARQGRVIEGKVIRTAAKRGPEAPRQHSSGLGGVPGVVDGGVIRRAVAEAGVHDAEPAAAKDADRLRVAFAARTNLKAFLRPQPADEAWGAEPLTSGIPGVAPRASTERVTGIEPALPAW